MINYIVYDFLTEPVTEIKKESEDTTVFIPEANETDENKVGRYVYLTNVKRSS